MGDLSKMKDKFIAIEDEAFYLGICDKDLVEWVKKEALKSVLDYRNRPAILQSPVKKYVNSKDYYNAIRKSILLEKSDKCRVQPNKEKHSKIIDQKYKSTSELY